MQASSSVGAMDKRSRVEHHVIGSFSTDPEKDEIILNEENLRQTEDKATYDDFRLQEKKDFREERRSCYKTSVAGDVKSFECEAHCRCIRCARCLECGK